MLERAVKWARRNPTLATSLAVSVLALLGLAVGAVWFADHERRRADQEAGLRADLDREHRQVVQEKDRARTNFTEALNAIEELLDEVDRHSPEDLPGLRLLREHLMDRAERFYTHLRRRGSDDPTLRRQDSLALSQLGRLQTRLGRAAEALRQLDAARAELQALLRATPEQPELWLGVAYVDHARGEALRQSGHPAEAEAAFDEALDYWARRLERFPEVTPLRRDLAADVHLARGELRAAAGDRAGAVREFQAARDEMLRLTRSDPSVMRFPSKLATAWSALAGARAAAGQAEAADDYRAAANAWAALAQDDPHATNYLLQQARALRGHAALPGVAPAEAVADLQQAVAAYRRLPAVYAVLPSHRGELAAALQELDKAYRAAGRTKDADALRDTGPDAPK
jgi:tetratricopeptide (TPR) repeat protein